MDENGRAGRRPGLQFGRGSTNRTTSSRIATGGERDADGRQCRDADVFLKHDQSRPLRELNAQLQRQGYSRQKASRS
jgi:hypothetical protein